MKMAVHDYEEVSVNVSKKAKLKKVKHSVCGPHGQNWKQTSRVCEHGFVNPSDWPFVDYSTMTRRQWSEYLCPHGCFEVIVRHGAKKH